MATEIIEFKIEGDSEGYITFECPYCGSEFKLNAQEIQNEDNPIDELFCPYCGLTDKKDNFYTKEVIEYVKDLAYNYFIENINKSFSNLSRNINSQKGCLKMKFKPLKKVNIKELNEVDTVEHEFTCNYCDNNVKVLYCEGVSKIFCPYCGVDM